MKILVIDNVHLYKDFKGNYYSPSIYDDAFFDRYTDVFEEVLFCAKVNTIENIDYTRYIRITRKDITIVELPWFRGLKGLILKYLKTSRIIRYNIKHSDACIFRAVQVESLIGYMNRKDKPYIVELVNDPNEYFHGIFRFFTVFYLNKMIKNANGVSYITKNVLQKKYPTDRDKQISSSYLTLDLEDSILAKPKKYPTPIEKFKLIHISNNIESDSKGYTTVIKTVNYVVKNGYDVTVTFIGDGTLVNHYKEMAKEYGISKNVVFVGRIHDKNEIYEYLSSSDLFIFPTQHEGLGRVNLEAQACGLPALASPVGGVVELYDPEYMINPFDFEGYGKKIIELINNPIKLERMSIENINNVKQYLKSNNYKKRKDFYTLFKSLISTNAQVGSK